MEKAPDAFRTISEVADDLDIPQHVLRFWETRFTHIKPMKRGGGRRYYRPADVDLLRGIKHLLYGEGYTIKGVQRILREEGVKHVQTVWQGGGEQEADPEPVEAPKPALPEAVPQRIVQPAPVARVAAPAEAAPPPRKAAVASFVDADDDPPQEAPKAPAALVRTGLGANQRRQLQAALTDLKDCRRLLKEAIEAAR